MFLSMSNSEVLLNRTKTIHDEERVYFVIRKKFQVLIQWSRKQLSFHTVALLQNL